MMQGRLVQLPLRAAERCGVLSPDETFSVPVVESLVTDGCPAVIDEYVRMKTRHRHIEVQVGVRVQVLSK